MLERLKDYDWEEVFKYASPEKADHNDDVDTQPFTREDVDELYGISDGYNDGDAWIAYGRLKDYRYFFIEAGCDYTGWGCQEGGSSKVASTRNKLYLCITTGEMARMNEG